MIRGILEGHISIIKFSFLRLMVGVTFSSLVAADVGYAVIVPFIENGREIFLKTAFPSRNI